MKMNEIILRESQQPNTEAARVQEVFGLDASRLTDDDQEQYVALVEIVSQFSRINPATKKREIISPNRIAAIPAITARHCELMRLALGELTPTQVVKAWRSNMPENDGARHPDLLFDMAQYNFGTDDPLDHVVRSLTQAEARRAELAERFKSVLRMQATKRWYERPLDDNTEEELVDELVDGII